MYMREKDETNMLIALDFAGTGLRAISAEIQEDNAVRIISDELRKTENIKYGIIEQPSGIAFNVTSVIKELINSSKITKAVTRFSSALGGRSMKVISKSITAELNKSKPIDKNDIKALTKECEELVGVEGVEVYDIKPVSYSLDGIEVISPIKMYGSEITIVFNLVVGSALIKDQFQKLMDRIGTYKVEYLPLAAEAFAIAVTEEEDRKEGCVVIDMGYSKTTITIYGNEIMQYLMVLPLGGNNITKDIQSLGLNEVQAEKLKCKFGVSMEEFVEKPLKISIPATIPNESNVFVKNTDLAMVIEARLDEMFQPVFNIIERYESQIPKGIIISGGAAKLSKIKEYFEIKTGLPVRYGDHSEWLTEDTPIKYHDLSYAQVIGNAVLAHDFSMKNKTVEQRPQKKKKGLSAITDLIGQGLFRFFEDDTELKNN